MKKEYKSLPGPYDEHTVAAHQHYLNNIMGSMLCYWEILDNAINVSEGLGEEELVGDFKLKDFSKQMRSLFEDYKSFMDYAKNNINDVD